MWASLLQWSGSGFCFAVGVFVGAWMLRSLTKEKQKNNSYADLMPQHMLVVEHCLRGYVTNMGRIADVCEEWERRQERLADDFEEDDDD